MFRLIIIKVGGSSLFGGVNIVDPPACASWSTSKKKDSPQCKYYGSVKQSDLTALSNMLFQT